jgi:hypothetical protein
MKEDLMSPSIDDISFSNMANESTSILTRGSPFPFPVFFDEFFSPISFVDVALVAVDELVAAA